MSRGGNSSKHPRPIFVFKLNKNPAGEGKHAEDTYAFLIAAKHLKLRARSNCSVYELCNIVERFPEVVDCSGIERQLTIILKIYAKIPEAQLRKQREMWQYKSLTRGKWVLSE